MTAPARAMAPASSKGDRTILGVGVGGSLVAALCCFTPILAIALGAIGLSAWLGWADYVLFPALALFLALAGYGFYRVRRHPGAPAACCAPGREPEAGGRS
jgi:mercuric ion transport protein